MKTFLVLHSHEYGASVFIVRADHTPDESEVSPLVPGGSFEPDRGESIEIHPIIDLTCHSLSPLPGRKAPTTDQQLIAQLTAALEQTRDCLANWMEIEDEEDHRTADDEAVTAANQALDAISTRQEADPMNR